MTSTIVPLPLILFIPAFIVYITCIIKSPYSLLDSKLPQLTLVVTSGYDTVVNDSVGNYGGKEWGKRGGEGGGIEWGGVKAMAVYGTTLNTLDDTRQIEDDTRQEEEDDNCQQEDTQGKIRMMRMIDLLEGGGKRLTERMARQMELEQGEIEGEGGGGVVGGEGGGREKEGGEERQGEQEEKEEGREEEEEQQQQQQRRRQRQRQRQ